MMCWASNSACRPRRRLRFSRHAVSSFKPETLKYEVLPDPLIYGIYAINEVLVRKSGVQPGAEKIYVALTMPPNPQVKDEDLKKIIAWVLSQK